MHNKNIPKNIAAQITGTLATSPLGDVLLHCVQHRVYSVHPSRVQHPQNEVDPHVACARSSQPEFLPSAPPADLSLRKTQCIRVSFYSTLIHGNAPLRVASCSICTGTCSWSCNSSASRSALSRVLSWFAVISSTCKLSIFC